VLVLSWWYFSNTAKTYNVLGDGANTFNSSGFYTYITSESVGNAIVVDSVISNFTLTFISLITGKFQATAEPDVNSNQTGFSIVLRQSSPNKRVSL
jgi:hypothetical protein